MAEPPCSLQFQAAIGCFADCSFCVSREALPQLELEIQLIKEEVAWYQLEFFWVDVELFKKTEFMSRLGISI